MKETTRHLPTQGVVLRYTNFKEADRMVTLLSPEQGKISVLARGCRKTKAVFLQQLNYFVMGNMCCTEKAISI